MIETLVELLNREMDEASRGLADLMEERRLQKEAAHYWKQHLHGANVSEFMGHPGEIAGWLRFGERADRELKMLEEKDFLVETRISECRDLLLQLTRRRDALVEVVDRRNRVVRATMQRRLEKDMMQRGMARRMLQEEGEPWD